MSVLATGLQGIQTGYAMAYRAGGQIASAAPTGSTRDLTTPLINLKMAEHQVKASAAVVKTANQMLGTLIDITA